MTRVYAEDLALAAADLEELAYAHDPRSDHGFHDIAKLLNLLVWAQHEIRSAQDAAAYGPGVKDGYHTLHRGGQPSDIDARTHDAYLKELRNLLSGWRVDLGKMADAWQQAAVRVGRWPDRSEQVG